MNFLITAALVTAMFIFSSVSFSADRISCKSFANQSEAQRHYDAKKKNWKSLDRDKDGEPCECLSGGSKAGESICKRWRKKNNK